MGDGTGNDGSDDRKGTVADAFAPEVDGAGGGLLSDQSVQMSNEPTGPPALDDDETWRAAETREDFEQLGGANPEGYTEAEEPQPDHEWNPEAEAWADNAIDVIQSDTPEDTAEIADF